MKRIDRMPIIKCILASLLILIFDYMKIDLLYIANNYANNAFEELFLKIIVIVPYTIYLIFVLYVLIKLISKIKQTKWRPIAVALVLSLTVLCYLYVPYSSAYAELQYEINKNHYSETIEMLNDGEISKYHNEENIYIVPYRFTSYTRLMYTQDSDGVLKIWFDVYKRFNEYKIIVFTSDDI